MDNVVLFATLHAWVRDNYPGWQALGISIELSSGGQKRKAKLPLPLTVLAPEPAGGVMPRPPAASHSDDFRTVSANGETYHFTASQAPVVRCLWEHHERGSPDVGQESLIELSDSDAERLRDVFRPGGELSPAWGALIVPGASRGTFRLRLD